MMEAADGKPSPMLMSPRKAPHPAWGRRECSGVILGDTLVGVISDTSHWHNTQPSHGDETPSVQLKWPGKIFPRFYSTTSSWL
jgi:hypothetical protein